MSAALPAVQALDREDKETEQTYEYEMVDGSVRVDCDGVNWSQTKSPMRISLLRSSATKSSPTKSVSIRATSNRFESSLENSLFKK